MQKPQPSATLSARRQSATPVTFQNGALCEMVRNTLLNPVLRQGQLPHAAAASAMGSAEDVAQQVAQDVAQQGVLPAGAPEDCSPTATVSNSDQQRRIHELRAKLPKGIHARVKALVEPWAAFACPVAQRRAQRHVGTCEFTAEEVARHRWVDDAWIVIDGQVYDVTDHLQNHHGWGPSGDATTPLSILAHSGMDCTEEFHSIHRNKYPLAYKQLPGFHIGTLAKASETASRL